MLSRMIAAPWISTPTIRMRGTICRWWRINCGPIPPTSDMRPLRIGVNALYLIPGGVGGTEIYLRVLLAARAEIDAANRYFVFTNRETGPGLTPASPNFTAVPQPIHAASRPVRILWEQMALRSEEH